MEDIYPTGMPDPRAGEQLDVLKVVPNSIWTVGEYLDNARGYPIRVLLTRPLTEHEQKALPEYRRDWKLTGTAHDEITFLGGLAYLAGNPQAVFELVRDVHFLAVLGERLKRREEDERNVQVELVDRLNVMIEQQKRFLV